MVQAPSRAPVGGPTLVRLLARLADAPVAQPQASPPGRLGEWLDWTRAVALSRALDGAAEPAPPGTDDDNDCVASCARARATLEAMIAGAPGADGNAAADDFAPFQRHCLAVQRAIQADTGRLRGQLRERLARRSPPQARLAEVDAAMEAALSPREHALLAALPALLGRRFERLRQDAPDAWLDTFRRDMRGALLAELDLRFEPVEALLAALGPR